MATAHAWYPLPYVSIMIDTRMTYVSDFSGPVLEPSTVYIIIYIIQIEN